MSGEPKLLTPEQVAEKMGVKPSAVQTERRKGNLQYIRVAGKIMYPREAVDLFIKNNLVMPCPAETPDLNSSRSRNATVSTTSAGPRTDDLSSEARALAICQKLNLSSENSSGKQRKQMAPVIQPDFR
tara:strand:- start:37465 stop:37848 length:384 start_codon:yes stop_codon:yes gene_type:complete